MPLPAVKLDGRSLVPLLEGRSENWPERALFQPDVVRTPRWRLNLRVETAATQFVEQTVSVPRDPAPVPQPDRLPKPQGVVKRWAEMSLGVLRLEAGPATLRLRTVHVPSTTAFVEIRGLELRRVK